MQRPAVGATAGLSGSANSTDGRTIRGTQARLVRQCKSARSRIGDDFHLFHLRRVERNGLRGGRGPTPGKEHPLALLLGTLAVTAIYVAVSWSFVHGLGFLHVQTAKGVAADLLEKAFGDFGGRAISLLICISALGVINGQIFTGARIAYAFGREHRGFGWMGKWSGRRGTPVTSLLSQAAVTIVLTMGFEVLAVAFRFTAGGSKSFINFTTPVFWFFFLDGGHFAFRAAAAFAGIIASVPRPLSIRSRRSYFAAPACSCSAPAFLYAVEKRTYEALWSVGILILGFVWCCLEKGDKRQGTGDRGQGAENGV